MKQGRKPGLSLQRQGQAIKLQEWGLDLLEQMRPVATLLDQQLGWCTTSEQPEITGEAKLRDPELTPSAQVLRSLSQHH